MSGSFDIDEPRIDLNSVVAGLAQRWIYHAGDEKVQHMTFNTPLDAAPDDMGNKQYCGRVVFSDFHVTTAATNPLQSLSFPGVCVSGPMTTQEKALVFMLFDLSSCVQSDTIPPIPQGRFSAHYRVPFLFSCTPSCRRWRSRVALVFSSIVPLIFRVSSARVTREMVSLSQRSRRFRLRRS